MSVQDHAYPPPPPPPPASPLGAGPPPYPPYGPLKRAGRRQMIIGASIIGGVIAVCLALWVVAHRHTTTELVTGTLELQGFNESDGSPEGVCWGRGQYSDLASRTPVVLRGPSKELDRTTLGRGQLSSTDDCVFRFDLEVPEGEDFYSLDVGTYGAIKYRWDEIRLDGIALVIGDPLDRLQRAAPPGSAPPPRKNLV